MKDEYTLKLGRRTAKLVAQCLFAFVRLQGYKLTSWERAVIVGLLKPLKVWVDRGPPRPVELRVVRGADDG